MEGQFELFRILPLPVVMHEKEKIIFANKNFTDLAGSGDNFFDWIRTSVKSKESAEDLVSACEKHQAISIQVEAKVRGIVRHWTLISHPNPAMGDSQMSQITFLLDQSGAQAKQAYWDLHVRMSNATTDLEGEINRRKNVESDLIQKSVEISQTNKDLSETLKELRKMQEQLLQSSKMSALGEMAGGIAHEINTPLAIIATLSAQMKELVSETPLDLAALTENANVIEATTQRIAKIIIGLRFFSRDASTDPFAIQSVVKIIDDTLVLCGERLKHHGIKLSVDNISPLLSVECRAVQLTQVLLNLLNNAIDAITPLSERWIRLIAKDLGEHIELTVTDSGSGLPQKIREKIFQPFFTTKEVGKGTGLGLSVSRGLIEAHRGELSIDTKSSNTCFVIRLPKAHTPKKDSA